MKDSPAKFRAERELSEKFERNFGIREAFTPNPKKNVSVTAKFYAKHEAFDFKKANPEMVNAISSSKKDIKERMQKPDTVNHSYGWYCDPIVRINRNDRRYFCPQVSSENTKTMVLLANDCSLKWKKFTGVPFKL